MRPGGPIRGWGHHRLITCLRAGRSAQQDIPATSKECTPIFHCFHFGTGHKSCAEILWREVGMCIHVVHNQLWADVDASVGLVRDKDILCTVHPWLILAYLTGMNTREGDGLPSIDH